MNIVVKNFLPEEIKIQIENNYKSSINVIPELLLAIKHKRKELENRGSKDSIEVINLAQFITIANIDFQILLKEFLSADNELEINFYSRVFANVLIGFLDGINPLLSKSFRGIFLSYIGNPDEQDNLQFIYGEIRAIKKDDEKYLREIRNSVIAHKDIDAQNQLIVIESIDNFRLMELNLRIVKLVSKMQSLISEILLLI